MTITHPFHPLSGRILPLLKRRVLGGVAMLQLQVGQDSVSVPESWTDRTACTALSIGGADSPLLSPEALRELLDLVAVLQAAAGMRQK